ncbi:hypothetical protein [Ligilactobacillus salivarius]|uniref:hypothetical protein n=1 Tax=Ligilactobacillus salivarius TaxID=1624 RepID=UPI002B46BD18|nr:hypothetical protein [Ligilactobacillus salivarius]
MRRYYKSTFWFMFFCAFSLIILSIIDGVLFVFLPNNAFVIMFDKFLSISVAPILVFSLGIAVGEIDKINNKFK